MATLFAIPVAQAQTLQPRTIYLFEHQFFQGRHLILQGDGGIDDLKNKKVGNVKTFNDRLSAIYISGPAVLTLYRDRDFGGPSIRITETIRDLRAFRGGIWNDSVSSVKWDTAPETQGVTTVTFYELADYQGRSFVMSVGDSVGRLRDKRRGNSFKNWNDKIESVKIVGTAQVILYDDNRFRGARVAIRTSVPDLGVGNTIWSDRASSVQVTR